MAVRMHCLTRSVKRAEPKRIEVLEGGIVTVASHASQARRSAASIHPTALCDGAMIGEGTRVWAFAHVMPGAYVGRQCNIGDHAFIENGARVGDRVTVKNGAMIWDGVTMEDDVFIGPGVLFTNDRHPRSPRMSEVATRYARTENWLAPTLVRRGASIGAGAIVLCGVTIGRYALVGAGALVTRDVPDHAIVAGHPAGWVGWACRCGQRLDEQKWCDRCGVSLCGEVGKAGVTIRAARSTHPADAAQVAEGLHA